MSPGLNEDKLKINKVKLEPKEEFCFNKGTG